MSIFVTIIHVLVCFILVTVVLLQSGKGADVGASFGGSSQTLFGSRGSATFLSKLTIGAAVFYFLTSLTLTVLKKDRSVISLDATQVKSGAVSTSTATSTKTIAPPLLPVPASTPPAVGVPTPGK